MTIKEFTKQWKEDIKSRTVGKDVSLAIIQVGDNEASNRYVRNKLKDCEEVGIKGNLYKFKEDCTTEDILKQLFTCKESGIIVQLPLPKQVDEKTITLCIPREKDVDGFTLGSKFTPCTPGGIIKYLENIKFNFDGAKAVVIGRSDIVGKPMAKLLLDKNCTVTMCHSHTKHVDLVRYLSDADLVVCAVGKQGTIASHQAPHAFIVDVGINFNEQGKLCGDVIIDGCDENRVTPVPGGVGLLTRCMLLENTLEAANNE